MADVTEIAKKLTADGPFKTEATSRRVRGLYNGNYVFDTTEAVFVWEHKYYPYYYIPVSAFAEGVLTLDSEETSLWRTGKIVVRGKINDRVVIFSASLENPLSGLVRVEHSSLDAWFVEDERIPNAHPKDPYSRIECLQSSRTVRIEISGHVIAESTSNIFLFETHCRPRFYLSPALVNWKFLNPSDTTSYCPYKGQASYYNIVVDGKEIKDGVWWYQYPLAESIAVAGRLCFYNEKVDVFIDGVKE